MTSPRGRFTCPVRWCAGDIDEHGGDGAEPDHWFHSSDRLPLSGPLWAVRWSTGSEAPRWAVNVGRFGSVTEEVEHVEGIAAMLEDAARQLRQLQEQV